MGNKRRHIILLIGKSGSGKSTIADILERDFDLKSIQSYTTRKPRYQGEGGHIFVNDKTFNELYPNMCAYTEFDGHRYGATIQQINENDIYVVDAAGVCDLVKLYNGDKILIPVYLSTSWLTRVKRMAKRGDSIKKIIKRLINDKKMFDSYIDNHGNNYPDDWPEVITINANCNNPDKLADLIDFKAYVQMMFHDRVNRKKVSDA